MRVMGIILLISPGLSSASSSSHVPVVPPSQLNLKENWNDLKDLGRITQHRLNFLIEDMNSEHTMLRLRDISSYNLKKLINKTTLRLI